MELNGDDEMTAEELTEFIKNYEEEIRSHGLGMQLGIDENGLYMVAVYNDDGEKVYDSRRDGEQV